MKELLTGVIGSGRVVRIILGGWEKAGVVSLLNITISDFLEEVVRAEDGPAIRAMYREKLTPFPNKFKGW